MRRIALFTEGQTEQIFVRECLLRLFDLTKLSFECWELLAHKLHSVPYRYPNPPNPNAEIFFMVINVHGDEGVISSIREREQNLIERGQYEKIIGLRDMYSEAYAKRSPSTINKSVSNEFIKNHNLAIQKMTHADKIKLHFAIMEVEAWFLGMYDVFKRIDSKLTVDYIKKKLNIDLKNADPQKRFYKPSEQVNSILKLCGRQYKKKQGEIESICSKINSVDFDTARENGRCKCLDGFYKEITNCV